MCTSFTWRKQDVFIAMNFDNNDTPMKLTSKNSQFAVSVGGAPCFGVNSQGAFINHLMVDSNGSGAYRRGKNVVHTIKLITDVLGGKLSQENISAFLSEKEVVNVPNNSCHCMIADKNGNVWVVEPGRGTIYSPAEESPFCLMTNFSLVDWKTSGKLEGSGTERYKAAESLLYETKDMDIAKAFEILKAAMQSSGDWLTAFSMVYSQKENAVYYCHNREFNNIQKFSFAVQQ